jgi:hypothetical protein
MLAGLGIAVSLAAPAAFIAYAYWRHRLHNRQAWEDLNRDLAEVGLSLRARSLDEWCASGTFRGLPISIETFEESVGEHIARHTSFRVVDTPLAEAAIYRVGSRRISDRGALEEIRYSDDFSTRYRVFARSEQSLGEWLSPAVRQLVADLREVEAIEVSADGVLRLVVGINVLDATSIRRCCDLLASIHGRAVPGHAHISEPLQRYNSSEWLPVALAPALVASMAGVGFGIAYGWTGFALGFGGVYLALATLAFGLISRERRDGLRRRRCLLKPGPKAMPPYR